MVPDPLGLISLTPGAPVTVFGLALVIACGHAPDTTLAAMVANSRTRYEPSPLCLSSMRAGFTQRPVIRGIRSLSRFALVRQSRVETSGNRLHPNWTAQGGSFSDSDSCEDTGNLLRGLSWSGNCPAPAVEFWKINSADFWNSNEERYSLCVASQTRN